MPSFGWFGDPPMNRFQPGSVRNSPCTWKVRTPWPKMLVGRACRPAEQRMSIGLGSAAAVPARTEGARRQELPAVGIGNVEREAAVGERVAGLVHPGSCRWRRPQRSAAVADRVEGQLHRPLQCSCGAGAIQVATARSGLIAFPMPLAFAAHACPRIPPRRVPLVGAAVNICHARSAKPARRQRLKCDSLACQVCRDFAASDQCRRQP